MDFKSIKILQNSQIDAAADTLRNELIKIGFEDIISETLGVTVPKKSSVIFSQSIPAGMRDSAIFGI